MAIKLQWVASAYDLRPGDVVLLANATWWV